MSHHHFSGVKNFALSPLGAKADVNGFRIEKSEFCNSYRNFVKILIVPPNVNAEKNHI